MNESESGQVAPETRANSGLSLLQSILYYVCVEKESERNKIEVLALSEKLNSKVVT